MKIIDVKQGSPEWFEHRRTHFNSSDAPAMLGCSPYKTRAQFLREWATGIVEEVDDAKQARFDDGHRYEALARPIAEDIVGEELYPCVAVSDDDERLSASFDGITMLGNIAWEHKTGSKSALAAIVARLEEGIPLPKYYRVQMEQQCLISGAERVLFMASTWLSDTLVDEAHCWYTPDPELRAEIIAGWEQVSADRDAYQPQLEPKPAPVGRAPETLPALNIQVTGKVLSTNLDAFRDQALAVLGGINRELKTDDDFADAEKTVKWCKGVEDRLAATKQQVLGQTADIDAVFRTLDDVSAETRKIRLELDGLVKREKESRKLDIVNNGVAQVRAHYASINATLREHALGVPASMQSDIGASIKGLKSLASMADAVDSAVAQAKIAASQQAERVRANMAILAEYNDHLSLFADRVQLCATKAPDDLRNLIAARIVEHEQRQRAREEAERERIRRAEAERLAREQEPSDIDDRWAKGGVEAERLIHEQQAAKRGQEMAEAAATRQREAERQNAVVIVLQAEPAADSGKRIKLGDINARIAPLSITAAGLAELGFEPVGNDRAAKLYAEDDFRRMRAAMVEILAKA